MTIVGTRPEAIKMIPVIRALNADLALETISVTTGQHTHMLDQVFNAFGHIPDRNLGLMTANQSLSSLTATVLTSVSKLFQQMRPDIVLVHGDTTTAMAAAMAAFYARIPIGHVEAGLRSHELHHPWPEEFNRVSIDSISDYLFAPTEVAANNLQAEYNRKGRIVITGNTGIDTLLLATTMLDADKAHSAELESGFPYLAADRHLVLVTGHRRENFGAGFQHICDGLATLATRDDVQIVYPVHLNPNVREVIFERLQGIDNIHLIEPVTYFEMVWLMRRAYFIITDSGGVQEEAATLGKPILVMRETTERPEALVTGVARLIGNDPDKMVFESALLLDNVSEYMSRGQRLYAYGDGKAAERICAALREFDGYAHRR